MKVCVSSTGKDLKSPVDERFGRCEYFLVVDTDKDETKVIENKAALASGGAGIAAAQQVVDEGAEYLITGNVGPNAIRVLSAGGVKVYRASGMNIASALENLKSGSLTPIDNPGPSHFGMRSGRRNR